MSPALNRNDAFVDERFAKAPFHDRLAWHNEPKRWRIDHDAQLLCVEPDAPTDFWQKTHYGFQADSGHLLAAAVSGDFVLTARVHAFPAHQYDQAGVMVRVSPACWIKSAVEFEPDGPSQLGAVVTNDGYSDWSMQPHQATTGSMGLRIRREADDYFVDWSLTCDVWQPLRVTHLQDGSDKAVLAGIYACSPKQAGFVAQFSQLTIQLGRV